MERSIPIRRSRQQRNNGGSATPEHGNLMFGFTVFLLSESVVFLSFFVTYIALRLASSHWFPSGFSGLDITKPAINTVILVSSSFVIYFAERALDRNHLHQFRGLLLLTAVMGTYFLVGQAIEWRGLSFGLTTGLFGATFYLLTGFHGLHVLVGILLQVMVLLRSLTSHHATPENHAGFSAIALFWHFVDVIWIVLFLLIYLWS
ncbi:MAG: heme-copper oxidase subunit III [Leptolyngbya sp. BL-A-14]